MILFYLIFIAIMIGQDSFSSVTKIDTAVDFSFIGKIL